jgi:hypothetical protein
LDAGANVVLTTKGIDDMCLKLFVEAGAMAVRRVTKEDMRRIAKATGGKRKRFMQFRITNSFFNLEDYNTNNPYGFSRFVLFILNH